MTHIYGSGRPSPGERIQNILGRNGSAQLANVAAAHYRKFRKAALRQALHGRLQGVVGINMRETRLVEITNGARIGNQIAQRLLAETARGRGFKLVLRDHGAQSVFIGNRPDSALAIDGRQRLRDAQRRRHRVHFGFERVRHCD